MALIMRLISGSYIQMQRVIQAAAKITLHDIYTRQHMLKEAKVW